MLVSSIVDARSVFHELRAVVVDEIHAFAGNDRGWHLLSVLERLSRVAGRPLQRIGLSATVGNPEWLLRWLQGSFHDRDRVVVAPTVAGAAAPEIIVDHVGTVHTLPRCCPCCTRGRSGWCSWTAGGGPRNSARRCASAA